uniref:Uncharacterized protein n=1 Tax=Ciona intestinalis TaxID=7719 RepID=F7A000_CIOIN
AQLHKYLIKHNRFLIKHNRYLIKYLIKHKKSYVYEASNAELN